VRQDSMLPSNNSLFLLQECYFQQDGAPLHHDVRNILSLCFPGRWIGRSGRAKYPPRSPDLKPLDFYLRNSVGPDTRNWSCLCRHSTTSSARSMSFCCTLLSTMHLRWWWTFRTSETLRKSNVRMV
jgi:hypothetical protein